MEFKCNTCGNYPKCIVDFSFNCTSVDTSYCAPECNYTKHLKNLYKDTFYPAELRRLCTEELKRRGEKV